MSPEPRETLTGHGRLERYTPTTKSCGHRRSDGFCSFLLGCYGPSYITSELAERIDANGTSHARCAPLHLQTEGKVERWHQTLMNRILLKNYFLPCDLEAQIGAPVELRPRGAAPSFYGRVREIISSTLKTSPKCRSQLCNVLTCSCSLSAESVSSTIIVV